MYPGEVRLGEDVFFYNLLYLYFNYNKCKEFFQVFVSIFFINYKKVPLLSIFKTNTLYFIKKTKHQINLTDYTAPYLTHLLESLEASSHYQP